MGDAKRASSGQPSQAGRSHDESDERSLTRDNKSGLWGALAGLFVFALIAIPLSAAFTFATHPNRSSSSPVALDDATQGGYQSFWWIVTIFLLALPFLVGYGVAKLSVKSLAIVGGIIALFVIAIMVLGQIFVF